jgi:hypothetical protein
MKRILSLTCLCCILTATSFIACRKTNDPFKESASPSFYSSDVLDKWLTLQIRLYKNAKGIGNGAFARPFAYSGIAALESLGQDDNTFQENLNGLGALPKPDRFKSYFWPASVNAALAEFNRSFFTSANLTPADLSAIDSLETAVSTSFVAENGSVINRSVAFGKSIADDIFAWSQTDRYNEDNAMTYTLLLGPGLWQLTPPVAAPAGPFWGNDRPIISGSQKKTLPDPPISYSEDPNSAFYKMANDVYAASQVLTDDQKAMAIFWRDAPGVTTPGHWMSIMQQVIKQTGSRLDKACYAYALVGICTNEARISVFETKYTYVLIRPVTYVRLVFQNPTWLPLINTPEHPEYISAHSVISEAASQGLATVFGDIGSFTDHTYDYMGLAPRTFQSFQAIATEAGNSRFYGGIHYQPSIDIGLKEGKKVASNVLSKLALAETITK